MFENVAGKHHIERAVLFVDAAGVTSEKPDFWKSLSRIADIGLTDIDANIVHLWRHAVGVPESIVIGRPATQLDDSCLLYTSPSPRDS